MKVIELYEKKKPDGTYAGVHFSKDTKDAIANYISKNKIPRAVPSDKLHTTVLYSRKHLPDYKPQGKIDPPYVGTPTKFEVWKTQPDENGDTNNCLILTYTCPELNKRHEALMTEHGATFDYNEYKPHITLSYDIGDMKIKSLPKFKSRLKIIDEYSENLNLDWAKTNTEKEK